MELLELIVQSFLLWLFGTLWSLILFFIGYLILKRFKRRIKDFLKGVIREVLEENNIIIKR